MPIEILFVLEYISDWKIIFSMKSFEILHKYVEFDLENLILS